MKEIQGNIWSYYQQGLWIVITVNGTLKKDGACVMGRGVAKQAKEKFPQLPYEIGQCIKKNGNLVQAFPDYHILTFPVKYNWWEKADLGLIEESCKQLVQKTRDFSNIYMVRPGCGNGQLDWKDVKPILEKYLDDRFVVVEKEVI